MFLTSEETQFGVGFCFVVFVFFLRGWFCFCAVFVTLFLIHITNRDLCNQSRLVGWLFCLFCFCSVFIPCKYQRDLCNQPCLDGCMCVMTEV